MPIIHFAPIAPELFLLAVIDLLALATVFMNRKGGTVSYQFSVLATAILSVWYLLHSDGAAHALFSNLFVSDPLGDVLKAFSAGAFCVTLVYSRRYLEQRDLLNSDFFALALLSLLGQFVMISGANLLTLYLGLEMLSLASYALVAMRRDTGRSSEAGIKYFILGALASGFLLYGMSMLYGATGSLDLKEIFAAIAPGKLPQLVLVFGLVFVVAGLAFKLGAAPFHMWVPDVYQGAPTAVTLLVAGAPKLAAFAMVIRLLVQGLLPLAIDWQQMLTVLAVLSLVIGNLTAIAQTNLKRMLAYSTISHMGFMLLGLLSGVFGGSTAGTAGAYSNAMFYAITYVLTTLGTFGVMLLLSRAGFEAEEIADLKGLNQRSPWFAFVMLLLMFSLAGIPPTVGFYAKLAVLQSVADAGMLWLAVVAVMMSLIGAFYYLRVVKTMYFDAPVDTTPLDATLGLRGLLSVNGILVVALGLAPTPLLALCLDAVRKTLG